MDSIKEKMPIIIAVIVAIAICGIAFYFLENYESVYFTQIDNTKIQSISATDEMKYEYTLDNIYDTPKDGKVEIFRDPKKTALTLITCKKNTKDTQVVYVGYLTNKEQYS